jgi:phosphoglycerate dehydrogenase-like enzyme
MANLANQLSTNHKMGGGPESSEHILCILPGEEPKQILEELRSRHPKAEITFISRRWGMKSAPDDLPKGKMLKLLSSYDNEWADNVTDIFKDKTILFTLGTLPASREECPNLKLIHLYSAGTDRVVEHPLFKDSTEIAFTNCSGVHGPQISEWVIMTALILNHSYNIFREVQKRHAWDRTGSFQVRDLVGQRLGVLGYGAIGRQGW